MSTDSGKHGSGPDFGEAMRKFFKHSGPMTMRETTPEEREAWERASKDWPIIDPKTGRTKQP